MAGNRPLSSSCSSISGLFGDKVRDKNPRARYSWASSVALWSDEEIVQPLSAQIDWTHQQDELDPKRRQRQLRQPDDVESTS